MKTDVFAVGLLAVDLVASAYGVDYEVASCAELAGVDDSTVTSLTVTSTPIECDSYTRFPVRNDMTIKSDLAGVVFSNFALEVLGSLTVEPDVIFYSVTDQVRSGFFSEKQTAAYAKPTWLIVQIPHSNFDYDDRE